MRNSLIVFAAALLLTGCNVDGVDGKDGAIIYMVLGAVAMLMSWALPNPPDATGREDNYRPMPGAQAHRKEARFLAQLVGASIIAIGVAVWFYTL